MRACVAVRAYRRGVDEPGVLMTPSSLPYRKMATLQHRDNHGDGNFVEWDGAGVRGATARNVGHACVHSGRLTGTCLVLARTVVRPHKNREGTVVRKDKPLHNLKQHEHATHTHHNTHTYTYMVLQTATAMAKET